MRVVTFNIRNGAAADGEFAWANRRTLFLKMLPDFDADVICLQEVLDFQLDEIIAALPDYSWVGVARDDGVRGGEFVPIFYRGPNLEAGGTFWLSDRPQDPGSIAWGARLPRICSWAQFSGFRVANLHLDHESETARTMGARLLLERLSADIVCGDFNAEPGEACIGAMESAGYLDLGRDGGGTFNGFRADSPNAQRIDYVFVRPPLGGRAHVLREPFASDHWQVVADLDHVHAVPR